MIPLPRNDLERCTLASLVLPLLWPHRRQSSTSQGWPWPTLAQKTGLYCLWSEHSVLGTQCLGLSINRAWSKRLELLHWFHHWMNDTSCILFLFWKLVEGGRHDVSFSGWPWTRYVAVASLESLILPPLLLCSVTKVTVFTTRPAPPPKILYWVFLWKWFCGTSKLL